MADDYDDDEEKCDHRSATDAATSTKLNSHYESFQIIRWQLVFHPSSDEPFLDGEDCKHVGLMSMSMFDVITGYHRSASIMTIIIIVVDNNHSKSFSNFQLLK